MTCSRDGSAVEPLIYSASSPDVSQAPPSGHILPGVPSSVTSTTFYPVVQVSNLGVNPDPFLRLFTFCHQVLFFSLNTPRRPPWGLSLSAPPPSWSEHPSSLLWITATSSRLIPLHVLGLFKAIFLEQPEWSFYNANLIASFFASDPSMTFHCF